MTAVVVQVLGNEGPPLKARWVLRVSFTTMAPGFILRGAIQPQNPTTKILNLLMTFGVRPVVRFPEVCEIA